MNNHNEMMEFFRECVEYERLPISAICSEMSIAEFKCYENTLTEMFPEYIQEIEQAKKDAETTEKLIESNEFILSVYYEDNAFYHVLREMFEQLELYDFIDGLFLVHFDEIKVNKSEKILIVKTENTLDFIEKCYEVSQECNVMIPKLNGNEMHFTCEYCTIIVQYQE